MKLLLLLASIAHAQVDLSFAPMGAETLRSMIGRRVPGVAVWNWRACTASEAILPGGKIYQAAITEGVVLFPPEVTAMVIERARARTWSQRTTDAGEGLALLGASLVTTKIVNAGSGWTAGLISAAGALHWLSGKLAAREPDLLRLQYLGMPEVIEIRGCTGGLSLGLWDKRSRPVKLTIP